MRQVSSPAAPYLFDEVAERELLGCLLADGDLRDTVQTFLREDDFYVLHHRPIYGAIIRLGQAPFYEIAAALASHSLVREAGGEDYIRALAVGADDLTQGMQLAMHVARLGQQRRVLRVAEDIARAAIGGRLNSLPAWARRRLGEALGPMAGKRPAFGGPQARANFRRW
jgi:replicative DNA helicase